MRMFVHIVVLCGIFLAPAIGNAEVAVNSRITIKPGNVDKAAVKLLKQAERLQGYFTVRSNTQLVLKIPTAAASDMQKFIEASWLIYQQSYEARDITKELLITQSRLKAKMDLLDEYQAILDGAKSDKVVKVATAVTRLIHEIETLRGKVNYLEHMARYAEFTVVFNIDNNQINGSNVTSSFNWLNQIGLQNLLSDFSQ